MPRSIRSAIATGARRSRARSCSAAAAASRCRCCRTDSNLGARPDRERPLAPLALASAQAAGRRHARLYRVAEDGMDGGAALGRIALGRERVRGAATGGLGADVAVAAHLLG